MTLPILLEFVIVLAATAADLVLRTAGHLRPVAEIAAAIILDRLGRHRTDRARVAS